MLLDPTRIPDDADLQDIEEFFDKLEVSIDWAEGVFTALFLGPDSVPPSTWQKEILRDYRPATIKQAQTELPLMLLLYNDVGRRLETSEDAVLPPPGETERVAEFCGGFLAGAALQASWNDDEEGVMFLLPFAALSGVLPDDEIELDGPITDLEAWKRQQREQLGLHLENLRAHFGRPRAVPVKAKPKIGRNDACPCGSGKKYKKCCALKDSAGNGT